MAIMRYDFEHDFPWWYGAVKWMIPLFLALSSALWFGLSLTGVIPWFGILKALEWTPGMFQVLDSLYGVGLLLMGMISIGSTVGVCTALLTRGLLLLPFVESLLINAQNNAVGAQTMCEVNEEHFNEFMEKLSDQVKTLESDLIETTQENKNLKMQLEIIHSNPHNIGYPPQNISFPTIHPRTPSRSPANDVPQDDDLDSPTMRQG